MQNIDMTLVNFKNLENFVLNSFLAMGLRNEDAKIFTDALMFSELRFHSGQGQGVQRITTYYKRIKNKEVNINIDLDIVKESSSLALVDAKNGKVLIKAGERISPRSIKKLKDGSKPEDIINGLAEEIASKNAFHVSKILDQSFSPKKRDN